MATYDAHDRTGLLDRAGLSLSALFTDLGTRFRRWNMSRVTREALSQLSDRELADIGVSRSQIREISERVSLDA
ncbi:MAG: DUF1127 domain-containing protein [Rhodobacteraceae bacterium]|nr:DUF1127 domain-containing protein [Paracoccaceae bacterium]